MSTEVIYARVPKELKQATELHANARGLSLAAAVSELLSIGVDAVRNEPAIDALGRQNAELERMVREEGLRREQAEQKVRLLEHASKSWTERAEQRVGSCPDCKSSINGHDLFVAGHCHDCGGNLSSLLGKNKGSDLDERELLVLVGAVGLLLGLLVANQK